MTDYAVDKWELFDRLGYKPHSIEQKLAHESDSRFRIPCCGRRWGKTTFGAREMLAACFIPDAYYWIVGPNYKLGEKEFRVIYRDLHTKLKIGHKLKSSYNVKQGDMRIEFPWRTVLEVVSAENKDSLIGEGLHGVIMAEAARHTMDTWEMYIEPALTDYRGWAIFPSTPRGYNWYHGLYKLGETGNKTYKSWRFPSWTNPVVFPSGRNDPEIVRIEQKVSKHYFEQEYAAMFSSFAGKIYGDEWDRNIHVVDVEYNPAFENYQAIDFGFTAPFVCLDVMVDPSENVYVWRDYQKTHMTTGQNGLYLKSRQNPQGYHVDAIYADPRGAEDIATLAELLGPVWGRPVPWSTGIEFVKRWMKPNNVTGKPKLYIDRSCTDLIRQIEGLRTLEDGREGRQPKEGQVDYDDHGPDALRYFFGEHFVLGGRTHLSDVYDAGYVGSEAETFYLDKSGLSLAGGRLEF